MEGIKRRRALALGGALALAAVVLAAWWLQPGGERGLAVPKEVCGGIFSGEEVKPLFRGGMGNVESDIIRGFPGSRNRSSNPVCELDAEGRSVGFRVDYGGFPDDSKKLKRDSAYFVEFGAAYGSYERIGGTVSLQIPCPAQRDPKATLFLNVGSSMAREGEEGSKAKLADLAGYAARTLAKEIYKCEGADELPSGPVRITRGEGSR